jgi:hypothetical protein
VRPSTRTGLTRRCVGFARLQAKQPLPKGSLAHSTNRVGEFLIRRQKVLAMASTMPKRDYNSIKRLCADGDELLEDGDHTCALGKYREAWEYVPSDKVNWEASTWILSSATPEYY